MFFELGLVSEATKLGSEGIPVHRLFSFEELKDATKNFHRSTLIGEGSTGKVLILKYYVHTIHQRRKIVINL